MKITNRQLQTAHAAAMRIPFRIDDRKLSSKTTTAVILLRVELDRHLQNLGHARRIAFESAKEGIEGYDEGIRDYLSNPEEHEDFKEVIKQVEQRFIPALDSILAEEVDINHMLSASELEEICTVIGDTPGNFPEEKNAMGMVVKPELFNIITGDTNWTTEEFLTHIASLLVA